MDVALVLTRDCNLACGYCFAGEKVKARMSASTADRAVEMALDAAAARDEILELQLFGGEPLLAWDEVVRVAGAARTRASLRGTRLALQLTTNGTLLDDEKTRVLGELGVHVALSLDGTAGAQDAARPTRGGGSSYASASAALDRLLATGRPFDVVTVVDPSTVGELARGVRELLDRGVSRLTLNPNWGAAWTDASLAELEVQYEAIAAILVAWFRRGRAVLVQPFDSIFAASASTGLLAAQPSRGCSAGVGSLAVAPSGRVYGCARAVGEDDPARAIGDLEGGVDPTRAARLGAPACEGACACANFEETGDASTTGRAKRRVDAIVSTLATRIARALDAEPVGRETFTRTFVRHPEEIP